MVQYNPFMDEVLYGDPYPIYACFTLGGLATDTSARVLNADGAPVPGLWAAGRTAASISSPGYSSGTSIGEAQIFGRIAGRSAAQGG